MIKNKGAYYEKKWSLFLAIVLIPILLMESISAADEPKITSAQDALPHTASYQYDRAKALAYARAHYQHANANYYQYGSDCANYLSQCLYAGGIPMTASWYHRKYKGDKENGVWLPEQDRSFVKYDIGEPWRLAKNQYEYFGNPNNGYLNGEIITISSAEKIAPTIERCAAEGNPIRPGDLLYFSNHHATMISQVTEKMIYFTSHSRYFYHCSLKDAISEDPVHILRLNDHGNGGKTE